MNDAQPLLELRGLGVAIGGRILVRDLSLDVRPGEVWCIVGANGSGKTTFLECVVGLRAPREGSIRLAGKALGAWTPQEAARRRGFLPQGLTYGFSASVMDVVMLGRHPHLGLWEWEGENERRLAVAALAQMDLAGMAERDITTLSGGERQRAAIAALVAQEVPLLVLDEPIAHLDLHHQAAILERLRAIAAARDHAVVLSLHDVNLAMRFATHAMLFHGNGVVDCGAVAEVLNEQALCAALNCRIARIQAGPHSVFVAA